MITTDKPYSGHGNSKSAKIRKLLLSEEAKSMTVDEMAKKMKVVPQRVYAARASLRKAGLLPPARAEVTGIASLPVGGGTITIPEYKDVATPTFEQMFAASQGRTYAEAMASQGRIYSAHLDPIEAADAASRVRDSMIEHKHLKQSFMAVVALSVFLAALLIYNYAK